MNQPMPKKVERPLGPLADQPGSGGPQTSLGPLAMKPEGAAAPSPAPVTPARPRDAKGRLLPKDAAAPATDTIADQPLPRRAERRRWGERRFNLPKYSRPGFRARVFNDVPGRLDEAKERGYAHVKGKDGKPISVVVDRTSGLVGFLMEIPKEFYDEDFADKQAVNDEIDRAMLGKADADGGYRPVVHGTNKPVTQAHVIRGREPT